MIQESGEISGEAQARQREYIYEKLTNSTVDCDIALLEREEKVGRSGRVQKRNMQKRKKRKEFRHDNPN